jgi:hypothetical protein
VPSRMDTSTALGRDLDLRKQARLSRKVVAAARRGCSYGVEGKLTAVSIRPLSDALVRASAGPVGENPTKQQK